MVDFCDDGDRNTMDKGILISPVPKEYAFYTDNEKIEKTEAYYRKMDDIYGRLDTFEEAYKNRIERLLQNEGKAADLTNVLKEKDAQLLCYCSYEFDIIRILCRIAELEESFKEPSVLRNVHTMEEAISWRHKCVFLLRRFEFDWEETDELLMMVTSKDIIWREDLFEGWDFYDVSQSFEMERAGYKIVVPEQRLPWCLHDNVITNFRNCDKNRRICLKEYPEYFVK